MALFNLLSGNNNNSDKPVTIVIGEDTRTISAAEAQGLTVSELFYRFASDMADVTRINRFLAVGKAIDASEQVKAGVAYRGCVTSEGKA